GFGSGVSWPAYGAAQLPAIVRYLRLSFWPSPLIFDYGMHGLGDAAAAWMAAPIVLGLAGLSAWALFGSRARRWRALGFCGAWFFAILAPTSAVAGNRQL